MPTVIEKPGRIVEPVTFIVLGASGDLARKKVVPALFALFSQGYLPERFAVVGFARTAFSDAAFRATLAEHLGCRCAGRDACAERTTEFLERCLYCQGAYDSPAAFQRLRQAVQRAEGSEGANRLFYMAIPPALFDDVTRAIGGSGLLGCTAPGCWSRAVIEKPFGSDRESSDMLAREMAAVFSEDQIYRIDHYLGKEIIQNLMVLRFANLIFEPIWNRNYVDHVQISWMEEIGVGERGGYFDATGIVRDVMQNHLLQMLALTAMEPPMALDAHAVREEKVKLLRSVLPLSLSDVVLGQYRGCPERGVPAYVAERQVAPDSLTPTYAAAVLWVRNRRWDGVPFLMRAGKALDARMTEIRIRFQDVPGNVFGRTTERLPPNELVMRVQPDEAIYFRIVNKVPGLDIVLDQSPLNLRYAAAFKQDIPDAYECLLLEVLQGDKSLFIGDAELAAAWDIFTPLLHEIERARIKPEPYDCHSRGPDTAQSLAARLGLSWTES